MATPSLFEYRTGNSLIHRLDPRAKLLLLLLFSISLSNAGWAGGLAAAGLLALGLARIQIAFLKLIRALLPFILFLSLIILTRALAGETPPLYRVAWFSVSLPGLVQGGLVALRFLDMMLLGLVFSATTRPSHLNAALQWAARPLPMVPEKRLGMIFSLALRFLPTIFRQAAEIRDAYQVRSGPYRKNPVQRITIMAGALFTRVLNGADATAMAMEARNYSEERTVYPFSPCGMEGRVILAGVIASLMMFWF